MSFTVLTWLFLSSLNHLHLFSDSITELSSWKIILMIEILPAVKIINAISPFVYLLKSAIYSSGVYYLC